MNKAAEVKRDRKDYKKRPQGNSTVAKDILAFWKKQFKWGDSSRIQAATGLSRPTIKSAFDGSATDEHIALITDYYLNLNKTTNGQEENQKTEG